MARRLLSTLAMKKGGRWKLKGSNTVIVIMDNHPSTPMIAHEPNLESQWVVQYCDLKRFATPMG